MFGRSPLARRLPLVAIVLAAVACTGGGDPDPGDAAPPADGSGQPSADAPTEVVAGTDGLVELPVRPGPREETTHGVPHIQLDAEPVPEVHAELRRRAYSLPGVEERESVLSLPGASSLWLSDELDLARPEVLQAGRECAHIHPNGSLHVWLPVGRAFETAETRWGELHPWVGRDDFWDGLVMVYTPEDLDELDVTIRLIVDAYNYVTGAGIDPGTVT